MTDESPRLRGWDELPEGVPVEVEATVDGEPESIVLFRSGPDVRGWLNVCPHAGRRLDWAPGRFLLSKEGHLVCAAHGASFETTRGLCIAGPCKGESLRAVALATDAVGVRLA